MALSRAIAIMDADSSFNVAAKFYSMFPHDRSSTESWSLDVADVQRVKKLTFEKLIDRLIELREFQWTTIDTFILVAHGFTHKDRGPLGLMMPLLDGSPMRTEVDNLNELLKHLNDPKLTEESMTKTEKEYSHTSKQGTFRFPKGSVSRLVGKMRHLRTLKVRRITFRACNIGVNVQAMSLIGQCLGARFAEGPKVHMFYMPIDTLTPLTEAAFNADRNFKASGARVFTRPGAAGEKLGIKIIGTGPSRNKWTRTTTKDLRWFIDKYVWPTSSYPPAGKLKASSFFIAGMDVTAPGGNTFALPLEKEWADQIVWTPLLPGNMI